MKLVDDQAVVTGERFAKSVDRRRTDIAEDDTDRTDRQFVQRSVSMAVTMRKVLWRFGFRAPGGSDAHSLMFKLDRLPLRIPGATTDLFGKGALW